MKHYTCPKCQAVITHEDNADLYEVVAGHFPSCHPAQAAPAIKRITDVLPPEVLKGNLITMDEIIDREVLVTAMAWRESTFKEDAEYLSLTLEIDGEEKALNTGATRVCSVFKVLPAESLPIYVRFSKIVIPGGKRVYVVG